MKLFTDCSEDSVGILQYHNEAFANLDSPFISLSHTQYKEYFPLDHLAQISNIAEYFYKIEPEIIYAHICTQFDGF